MEIRQQILWGNKLIKVNGKTLFHQNWHASGINFIDDLLNEDGRIKSGEEIVQQLRTNRNWITEYSMLLKAIPRRWKDKINDSNTNIKVGKTFKPFETINNKVEYNLPSKRKFYCQILIQKRKKELSMKITHQLYSPIVHRG